MASLNMVASLNDREIHIADNPATINLDRRAQKKLADGTRKKLCMDLVLVEYPRF
jgi:hypothetical protein